MTTQIKITLQHLFCKEAALCMSAGKLPSLTHALLLTSVFWLLTSHLQAGILTAVDVQQIVDQASSRAAKISPDSTIAVVDREGNVLVVWAAGAAPTPQQIGEAISRAGTACFLSSNQNAFTTRTATYIVQDNFPPGLDNRSNGPLTGVNFSHLPYSDVNRFRAPPFPAYVINPPAPLDINTLGTQIPFTSLSGFIGGVPLYKNKELVGGVGVVGDGKDRIDPDTVNKPDVDEDVALAGQKGFEAPPSIRANRVFLEGISVPYVKSSTQLPNPLTPVGGVATGVDFSGNPLVYPLQGSPLPPGYPDTPIYPTATFAGVTGEIRSAIITDPVNPSPARLTAADVNNIIEAAIRRALITRSNVRNPLGGPTSMWVAVVGNSNNNSVKPPILGIFKMPDGVTRSWDFVVQKGRTCVGFSSTQYAFSSRTVGFLSQNFYPPGIKGSSPGPFRGLQATYSNSAVNVPPSPFFANGITIFPGGQPLYRDGILVGGIGISGDAIDQDDLVAAAGAAATQADGTGNFVAPGTARADRYAYRGVRLPFAKFPRQPVR